MDIIRSIRCILCLLKCNKYLYFAKKMLCLVTLLITAVFTVSLLKPGKAKGGLIGRLM